MKKVWLLGMACILVLTGCVMKQEVSMKTEEIFEEMERNVESGKVFYYAFLQKWREDGNAYEQKGDFAFDKNSNAVKFKQVTKNDSTKQELSNYLVDGQMYRHTKLNGKEQLLKIKQTETSKIVYAMKDDIYQTISAAKKCLESNSEVKSKQGVFSFGEKFCDNDIFENTPGTMSIKVNAETFDFTIRVEGEQGDLLEVSYDKDTKYIVKLPMDKDQAQDDEQVKEKEVENSI